MRKDRYGETALDYAILKEHEEIVALLREHGAIESR